MQLPLQISLHGIEPSDALYNAIREKAEKLDRYYEHIMSCRVVLELAGRHKHRGKQFVARVDLKVPGGEIVVTHEHDADPQVALRDAFDAARRRLEDYARTQRGDVKRHAPEVAGRVARIDPEQGFGFIATDDGREYYFSRENVVTPPFESLVAGTPVRFIEEVAGEGLQAKRVSAHGTSSA
ncbi:MAG: 30S ribosomal protein S30 [Betaproteobacteria bacterium RIFCSPLOWO2_12_FULL_65_14]|nr:MAG: 30S ribosomal protein S30 [Betaproteobacteria bacterium RIFCSPLOWO2_12_FULL_65_14]